jgi:hypothetical protein
LRQSRPETLDRDGLKQHEGVLLFEFLIGSLVMGIDQAMTIPKRQFGILLQDFGDKRMRRFEADLEVHQILAEKSSGFSFAVRSGTGMAALILIGRRNLHPAEV